jgi:hypothetical protein
MKPVGGEFSSDGGDEEAKLRRGGLVRLGAFFIIILALGMAMILLQSDLGEVRIPSLAPTSTPILEGADPLFLQSRISTLEAEVDLLQTRINALETQQAAP